MTPPNYRKYREKLNHSYIACGNVKWYSHPGKQFGIFLQNWIGNHHLIQQMGFWAFIPEKWKLMFKEKPITEHAAALFVQQFSRWMINKLMDPNYGIFVSNKKEWTIVIYNHLDESPGADVEWKKKVNHQRLPTVWFHLWSIFKMETFWKWRSI